MEIQQSKTAAAMVSYRSSTPLNEILCGNFQAGFKSPALQCKTCKIQYHPTCAKMPLYYMVRYTSLSVSFECKQYTEKSAGSNWTDTVHLFKACYPNLTDVENPLNKNETDVRVETESISQQVGKAQKQAGKILKTQQIIKIKTLCKIKTSCKIKVTTAIIHTLLHAKNILKTLNVDADQNAPITTQIFANILCNSESATT